MPTWLWFVGLTFLVAIAAAMLLVRSRLLSQRVAALESQTFALVGPEKAGSHPYPYVYIDRDGTARELHPEERSYLETAFSPFDGARPYAKTAYADVVGHPTSGYCSRSLLPQGLPVGPAPGENPRRLVRGRGWFSSEDGSQSA